MRYVLTLTIAVLAALAATVTTASAHDTSRFHRAVEARYSYAHHKMKRQFHHRRYRRARAYRYRSRAPYRSRFVIVIRPGGVYRFARGYH